MRLPFVDLSSAARRAFFCCEEIRLNRRFAPELYLGVCEITGTGIRAAGAVGPPAIDHAVRLRQFGEGEVLDRLLEHGRVTLPELRNFGRHLARLHAGLPPAPDAQAWGFPATIQAAMLRNIDECVALAAELGTYPQLDSLRAALAPVATAATALFRERRRGGRVRECHGDLHAGNIVRYGGRLLAFDCLEFEPSFRWIDVAEEVAFLLMDLEVRGRHGHAAAFLSGYLDHSGDYGLCRLLRLYGVHRALVRAKVSAIEAREDTAAIPGAGRRTPGVMGGQGGAPERHRAYVDEARRLLEAPRARMVLMHGLSGSGKTWLATQLAAALGAVHIRSDVERKRLAGLPPQASSRSAPGEGLYSARVDAAVYGRLLECAADVLYAGYPVIVDAAFIRRDDRERFAALAARLGAGLCLVDCHATRQLRERRIIARRGHDASEADLPMLDHQDARAEPIGDEGYPVISADTERENIAADVADAVARDLLCTVQPRG